MVGPATDFYKAALLYLSYTPIESLTVDEKYLLATDMALAAICGDGLFNFGEVLATPLLSVLDGTPNEWLKHVVIRLHSGDVSSFNQLLEANQEAFKTHEALVNSYEKIKQKMVLLSLMNLIFRRSSHDRCVSYSEIAQTTQIPLSQVMHVADGRYAI